MPVYRPPPVLPPAPRGPWLPFGRVMFLIGCTLAGFVLAVFVSIGGHG